jgi:hypothetical protein
MGLAHTVYWLEKLDSMSIYSMLTIVVYSS